MVDELPRVLTATSGILGLAIGLYVYLKGRDQLVNSLYFLTAVFISMWSVGEALTMGANSLEQKIFWTKFQGIGEMLLVPTFLTLALYFPRPKPLVRGRKRAALVIASLYAPWVFGIVLLYTTGFLYSSYYAADNSSGIDVVRTPFFWVLTALGFLTILAAVAVLLLEYRRSASMMGRRGLLLLALAPLAMLAANLIYNLRISASFTTPQASLLFTAMLGYGILRYGLFLDIRSITRNALAHVVVIVGNLSVFVLLCAFYIWGLNLEWGTAAFVLFVITGMPFMIAYPSEVKAVKTLAGRYIYGRESKEERLLEELSRSIRTVRDLDGLASRVVEEVRSSLGLSVCVLLLREDGAYRGIGFSYADDLAGKFADLAECGLILRRSGHIFSFEDGAGRHSGFLEVGSEVQHKGCTFGYVSSGLMRIREGTSLQEITWKEGLNREAVLVPLEVGGEEVGMIWLGSRPDGMRLSLEELDLISVLSTQVAVSLLNSLLLQELLDKSDRLQALMQMSTTAQEEERMRISRELHDGLAPYFLDILFKLDMVESRIEERSRSADLLDELRHVAREGLRDLRKVIADLRPSSLEILGLEKTLASYLERFGLENGLFVEFVRGEGIGALDSPTEVAVYRVAQEALSNVAQHAGATSVRLSLGGEDGCLELVIEDDGAGFAGLDIEERMLSGHCLGIKGMRERAELIQGELEVDSSPGEGTAVRLRIPYR